MRLSSTLGQVYTNLGHRTTQVRSSASSVDLFSSWTSSIKAYKDACDVVRQREICVGLLSLVACHVRKNMGNCGVVLMLTTWRLSESNSFPSHRSSSVGTINNQLMDLSGIFPPKSNHLLLKLTQVSIYRINVSII